MKKDNTLKLIASVAEKHFKNCTFEEVAVIPIAADSYLTVVSAFPPVGVLSSADCDKVKSLLTKLALKYNTTYLTLASYAEAVMLLPEKDKHFLISIAANEDAEIDKKLKKYKKWLNKLSNSDQDESNL